jgi:hypothetical protein
VASGPPGANVAAKMSERRHGPAFEHAAVALGPLRQPLPAEFRPVRDEPRWPKTLCEQQP